MNWLWGVAGIITDHLYRSDDLPTDAYMWRSGRERSRPLPTIRWNRRAPSTRALSDSILAPTRPMVRPCGAFDGNF
jgi:hypothetical protein